MNYKTVIIVDENEKKSFLENSLDSSVFVYSAENVITNGTDICISNSLGYLEDLKTHIANAEVVYIVPSGLNHDGIHMLALMEFLDIKQYYSLDYDINDPDLINHALENSRLINKNEVRMAYAELAVARFFKCSITKVIQWYFDKEELATNQEISTLSVTLPALTSLAKIVIAEERIENFIPEEFRKVGIDYLYDGQQFTARNNKKFGKKLDDELELMLRRLSHSKSMHIVKDFTRETKNIKPPSLLTLNILERIGVSRFGFSIEHLIEVATELRKMEIIIEGEKSGPLITPIYTMSKKINPSSVLEISNLIMRVYGEDYVYSGSRAQEEDEEKKASRGKEAISPTNFTEAYFPKNIKPHLTEDQYKVYSVIFYRTVAAFMSDATINTSELIVSVEGIELKAISNIVSHDDVGNYYDGWLKIGPFLGSDEADMINENSIIPSSLYPGQEFTREANEILDARVFTSNERNPARYGEGRLKSLLIKEGLIPEISDSSSINQLKNQKLASPSSGTLHPTSLGKRVYYTLDEYADWVFNEEFTRAYVESLNLIIDGDYTKEALMEQFYLKEAEFKKNIGYKESVSNNAPEQWVINKARKVANQCNVHLSPEILKNRKLLFSYIENNDSELEKLGRCMECKKGEIYEQEKGFFCNNSDCNFTLWKTNIERFFKYFKKHIPIHDYKEVIRVILMNKKCNIDGLYNSKKELSFNADITLSKDLKYRKWKVDFYREGKNLPDVEKEIKKEKQASATTGKKTEDSKNMPLPIEDALIEKNIEKSNSNTLNNASVDNNGTKSIDKIEIAENEDDDILDNFLMQDRDEELDSIEYFMEETPDDLFEAMASSFEEKEEALGHGTTEKTTNSNNAFEEENEELENKINKIESEKRLLEESSIKDGLTRAYNKGKFLDDIEALWSKGRGQDLVIAFIDADKFKNINDSYGHNAGDRILVEISNILFRETKNTNAEIYRYGGEEFILLSQEDSLTTLGILERIRDTLEKAIFPHKGKELSVTVSIGVAYGLDKKSHKEMLTKADNLLYLAKENGRNNIKGEDLHELKNNVLKKKTMQLQQEKKELREHADIDKMTKTFNRGKFNLDIESIEKEGGIKKTVIGFVDVDDFKKINDEYGHDAGDEALIEISRVLLSYSKRHDIKIYRYGGEEFCIISHEDIEQSIFIFDEIRREVARNSVMYNNISIPITLSIGVADGEKALNVTELVTSADSMVYFVKKNGKNAVAFDGEICYFEDEDEVATHAPSDIQKHIEKARETYPIFIVIKTKHIKENAVNVEYDYIEQINTEENTYFFMIGNRLPRKFIEQVFEEQSIDANQRYGAFLLCSDKINSLNAAEQLDDLFIKAKEQNEILNAKGF